ncbi:receptor-like protein 7 [Pistacia vera]|uniref:receptor-like protein 7 n=1 Tax=Pistacia vera TaxID=55513 RepID=UPI001262C3B4|nr:receptor-like protein 7 [Pistacia vera]
MLTIHFSYIPLLLLLTSSASQSIRLVHRSPFPTKHEPFLIGHELDFKLKGPVQQPRPSSNFLNTSKLFVSSQCQSDEQLQLLQMKNSLVFSSNSSVNLAQWDQNTDCCVWSGVDCDEAGHVISLNLSNESISGGIENATGLFALQNLNSLNLAYNRFNATQIPSRLANLKNLTYLNLSEAGFTGQIPSSISGMTKLVTLDLSSLNFLGSSVLKLENPNLSTFLQNFTEIRELYLDGVNISAHGNEWCKALSSSLPNLQVLIPGFLAEFMNLTSLRLSYCGLLGTFPENIFQVPTLQNLDLSNNELLKVLATVSSESVS